MNQISRPDLDHVTVVGAGVVGSTLAALLGQAGVEVALIDQAAAATAVAADDYDLRVLALTTSSERILASAGAWPGIAQARYGRMASMQVWDATQADGERFDGERFDGERFDGMHFDSAEVGRPNLGYIVEQRVVLEALSESLKTTPNISWYRPGRLAAINQRGQYLELILADEQVLRTKLLVGADGQNSQVRLLAGIAQTAADYHQRAVVATVRTEQAHQDTARQVFLPSGPLAFLPLDDPTLCSIVWSTDETAALRLTGLASSAFNEALASAFEHRLGAVTWSSERRSFPLSRAHAQTYTSARLALIGDAAHTIHPLAGQGANLGILDAAVLAQSITDAASDGIDIGSRRVVRRYERWRRGENLLMQWSLDALKQLFASETDGLRSLRNFGLRLTDKAVPIKRLIIERASGLRGDLPDSAR